MGLSMTAEGRPVEEEEESHGEPMGEERAGEWRRQPGGAVSPVVDS